MAFCRFIWQRLSLCRGCAQQDSDAPGESSILHCLLLVLQDIHTLCISHRWLKKSPQDHNEKHWGLWIQSSCLCSFAGACLSCPLFCKTSAGWRKWGREEELEPVVCSIAPRGISEPGEEASPLQTVPSPFLSSSEPRWWCLATLWWQPRRKQKGEALSLEPGLFVCPSLWVCIAWL